MSIRASRAGESQPDIGKYVRNQHRCKSILVLDLLSVHQLEPAAPSLVESIASVGTHGNVQQFAIGGAE